MKKLCQEGQPFGAVMEEFLDWCGDGDFRFCTWGSMDLTELQRECNKKFGFSAKKTLDIAQSLYEKRKMITYPRTDSRYLSEDMKGKVKSTIHRLQALEEYAPYVEPLMQEIRL